MRNLFVLAITATLLSFISSTSIASQLPSCDDLDMMAASLDEAAEALHTTGEIARGSDLDASLGELANSLLEIARIEDDLDLADAVNGMGGAWEVDEWETMKEELDNVIASLDALLARDCN